jgi:hypothetical protein
MALFIGHWQLRGYGWWAVEDRRTGDFLGRIGLYNPEGWPGIEIGWLLRRQAWGHRRPQLRIRRRTRRPRHQPHRPAEHTLDPCRRKTRRDLRTSPPTQQARTRRLRNPCPRNRRSSPTPRRVMR